MRLETISAMIGASVYVSAAPEFKVTTKFKIEGKPDVAMFDLVENGQLRSRGSIEDPTVRKLVNIYQKYINNEGQKYKSTIGDIQKPGYVTKLILRTFADIKPNTPINVMDMGKKDQIARYIIELVNSRGLVVRSADDFTPVMELKVTPTH